MKNKIIILLICNILISICSLYKSYEIFNIINDSFDNHDNFLEIMNKEYYSLYELDNSGYITIDEKIEDYMIYFHSNNCSACLLTNVYVDKYINYGNQNKIPIYFATKDKCPDLFLDKNMNISVTPTMIYFKTSDKKYYVYEGLDEIASLLDGLIKNE